MGSRSVLEALEDICNVDVDAIDPAVSTAMPFKPHNHKFLMSNFGLKPC